MSGRPTPWPIWPGARPLHHIGQLGLIWDDTVPLWDRRQLDFNALRKVLATMSLGNVACAGSFQGHLSDGQCSRNEVSMPKQHSEIEFEILRILSREAAMLPVELVRASDKIKAGSVHVYLGRLRQKKWVRSFLGGEIAHSGALMHRYSITGIGMARHKFHLQGAS